MPSPRSSRATCASARPATASPAREGPRLSNTSPRSNTGTVPISGPVPDSAERKRIDRDAGRETESQLRVQELRPGQDRVEAADPSHRDRRELVAVDQDVYLPAAAHDEVDVLRVEMQIELAVLQRRRVLGAELPTASQRPRVLADVPRR